MNWFHYNSNYSRYSWFRKCIFATKEIEFVLLLIELVWTSFQKIGINFQREVNLSVVICGCQSGNQVATVDLYKYQMERTTFETISLSHSAFPFTQHHFSWLGLTLALELNWSAWSSHKSVTSRNCWFAVSAEEAFINFSERGVPLFLASLVHHPRNEKYATQQ